MLCKLFLITVERHRQEKPVTTSPYESDGQEERYKIMDLITE